jgi:hypothetical protein
VLLLSVLCHSSPRTLPQTNKLITHHGDEWHLANALFFYTTSFPPFAELSKAVAEHTGKPEEYVGK